jgi:GNAT superfamily N-acetyltransferase
MAEGYWNETEVLINGEESCIYATNNKQAVGCLVYRIDEALNAVVVIAYVAKDKRGLGIYRAMHDLFVEKAKEAGALVAVNICMAFNTGIQETVKKLGYSHYTQEWRKKL